MNRKRSHSRCIAVSSGVRDLPLEPGGVRSRRVGLMPRAAVHGADLRFDAGLRIGDKGI